MAKVKIICPKCDWEPQPSDLWTCSCGHAWHTFDTGGRCPSCNKQWDDTQCLGAHAGGCTEWSPHLEWYRNLDDWVEEEVSKVEVKIVETEEAG